MNNTLTEDDIMKKYSYYSDKIENIKLISFWGKELENVLIVSSFYNVQTICFSCNNISSLEAFKNCSNLKEIYLRKNKISNITELDYIKGLKNLKLLWLNDNPITQVNNYRKIVEKKFPFIENLDKIKIKNNTKNILEKPDDDNEFSKNNSKIEKITITNFENNCEKLDIRKKLKIEKDTDNHSHLDITYKEESGHLKYDKNNNFIEINEIIRAPGDVNNLIHDIKKNKNKQVNMIINIYNIEDDNQIISKDIKNINFSPLKSISSGNLIKMFENISKNGKGNESNQKILITQKKILLKKSKIFGHKLDDLQEFQEINDLKIMKQKDIELNSEPNKNTNSEPENKPNNYINESKKRNNLNNFMNFQFKSCNHLNKLYN